MADIALPALDAAPEDWQVYADALQNAGDPRGEFYSLTIAAATSGGNFETYLADHAAAIYGDLAAHRKHLEIEWCYCAPAILTVKVGPKDKVDKLFEALLASPVGQTMHALRVVAQTPGYEKVNLRPGLRLLQKSLTTTCTSVELIDERASESRMLVSADYDPGTNLVDFGSLDLMWGVPHLERLHLYVADTEQIKLDTIRAPKLRDFAVYGLRWAQPYSGTSSTADALAKAKWPALERLALRIPETYTYSWPEQWGAYMPVDRYNEENEYYDDDYDDDGYREDVAWSRELKGVLENLATNTKIKHLSLTSFASGGHLLQAFVDGLPPSLISLDLSESDLNDDDAAWIVEHAAVFEQLELLDLSDTQISSDSLLEGLKPEVIHSPGGGARYQFSVGME